MFQQILYYLIIFPIYLLIECSFMCIYLCTDNPILAILIVSILVNIFCLPFYLGADKIYERNIEIQNKMKEKITSIKKNFKGKEKFFLISEVYKQYNYSPFLNFKSILGIIVQVPFFIAAYSFFSHLTEISNISFLFINDLQKPDNILNFNDITINILPIIMTIINIISSEIYIRTLKINKRISIYATSLIFLVLLYNSPSCLVIYWIFNNIFSLIKNIIIFFQKSKKLENKNHYEEIYKKNYNVITILCSLCFCFLFSITFTLENSNYLNNVFFISFINFITNILCLSFGMFFLYPITFYYYLNTKNKRIMAYTIFGFLCCSLLNFIILNRIENCASFDPFNFLQWTNCTHSSLSIIASYIILLSVTLFTFMLQKNSKNTLHTQKTIIISIIVILSSILSYDIIKLHKTIKNKDTHRITPLSINGTPIGKISNNIELSKDKKNIILFFLDSASSYSMNLLLKDEPSFKNYFDGFTFFQDTISYSSMTTFSFPTLLGGYEYQSSNINETNFDIYQWQSIFMLPIILSDFDFLFNYDDVINMTPDDSSIFATKQNPKKMKEFLQTTKLIKNKITHSNMNFIDSQKGTYNQYFKTTKRKIPEYISSRNGLLYSIMITTPIFIRDLFFLKGYDYFNTNNNELTAKNDFLFFKEYSHLNELQNITNTNTNKNTYTVVYNLGIHFWTDYTNISWLSNNKGCTNVDTSFVNTMSALVKYIEHLKDIEIYDNTRIIVVGDHGGRALNYIHFPDEQSLKQYPVDNDPILLYKDFNKRGNLVIDKTYMTVGDIPFLVLKDIVNKPINPFTNNQIIELTQKQKEAYPVCNTWGECFYNVHTEYREHQKCNDCKSNNCKSCELTLFRGM